VAAYRQRLSLLRPDESFLIDGEDLVRRSGQGDRRWPLTGLREARITRQPLGPQAARLVLQLRFGPRDHVTLTSHSISGIGRFQDDTAAFRAFALELLARAPQARLARWGPTTAGSLWLVVIGLGIGALVMVASAIAGGAFALGLDLGARMVFLLLLAAAALPWLARAGRLDRLTPEDLLAG
jgi:hypothetical protein